MLTSTVAVVGLVFAMCACGSGRRAERAPAPAPVWSTAWRSPYPQRPIPFGSLVLVHDKAGGTAALDVATGRTTWIAGSAWLQPSEDGRLYGVRRDAPLTIASYDPANGSVIAESRVAATAITEPIVLGNITLLLDGAEARLVDAYTGHDVWRVPDRHRAINFVDRRADFALLTAPYAVLRLSDGRVTWTAPGCCRAAFIANDLVAYEHDGQVELITTNGARIDRWQGPLAAADDGAVVVGSGTRYTAHYPASRERIEASLSAQPAPGSLTVDNGSLYFADQTGSVWEHDLASATSSLVYRARRSRTGEVLVLPVVVGDRVYVEDDGWVALDRTPSRSPIRDLPRL